MHVNLSVLISVSYYRVGQYELELHVLSDCYMGIDTVIPVSFSVCSAAELPEYKAHKDDIDLDNEPTLFEQIYIYMYVCIYYIYIMY